MTHDHSLIEQLTERYELGEEITYLLFWSHINRSNLKVDRSCLSQWYPSPFTVHGVTYFTAEHWMMAAKALLFSDFRSYDAIVKTTDPRIVKQLGRSIIGFNEDIWSTHRYKYVVNGNIHKFNQNPQLAEFLLSTNGKVLVEASPTDRVWGIGLAEDDSDISNIYCWKGLNLLGFALMEARSFIADNGHFSLTSLDLPLPWIQFPNVSPHDLFWRMGKGEGTLNKIYNSFNLLNPLHQELLKRSIIVPYEWADNFL